MAAADRFQAAVHQRSQQVRIGAKRAKMARHLLAISGEQEVLPRPEEIFAIGPGRGHQRNAAGQGFEHTDRRDAGQELRIIAAWDMDRRHVAGEYGWKVK